MLLLRNLRAQRLARSLPLHLDDLWAGTIHLGGYDGRQPHERMPDERLQLHRPSTGECCRNWPNQGWSMPGIDLQESCSGSLVRAEPEEPCCRANVWSASTICVMLVGDAISLSLGWRFDLFGR